MATGDPTGAYLCSATISAAVGYRVFTQDSNPTLEGGKKYAISAETTGLDASNHLRDRQDTNAGYGGGLKCVSADGGSTWTQAPSRDLWFATHDTGDVERDNYKTVNAFQAVYGAFHIAQTFTVGLEFDIKSITLWLSSVGDISGGTITCGIKKVEGETYADAPPSKAQNPTPSHAATDTTLDQATIAWEDGGGADTFDVYYGTASGSLSLVSSAQAGASFSLSPYTPYGFDADRYWRIDSTNVYGTTTGDEWAFTTIVYTPPLPSGITLINTGEGGGGEGAQGEGTQDGAPNGLNNMYTVRRLVAVANGKFWFEEL